MFARVTMGTTDREASARFYRTVLAALGHSPARDDPAQASWSDFALAAPGTRLADTGPGVGDLDAIGGVTRRLHLGFSAPSRAHVDAFWRAGVDAGYRSDGEPGPRPQYTPDYYGAFLLDPDGNSAEAVHRTGMRTDGTIDHLWIRVADLAVARPAYVAAAGAAGLRIRTDEPDHLQLVGPAGGSLSVVPGPRTEHLSVRLDPPPPESPPRA